MLYETKTGVLDKLLEYQVPEREYLERGILLNQGSMVSPLEICKIIIDEAGIHYYWDEYNELCDNERLITSDDLEKHKDPAWVTRLLEQNAGQEHAFLEDKDIVVFVRRAAEAYGIMAAYTHETCPYANKWFEKACVLHGYRAQCDHVNPTICPFAENVTN